MSRLWWRKIGPLIVWYVETLSIEECVPIESHGEGRWGGLLHERAHAMIRRYNCTGSAKGHWPDPKEEGRQMQEPGVCGVEDISKRGTRCALVCVSRE